MTPQEPQGPLGGPRTRQEAPGDAKTHQEPPGHSQGLASLAGLASAILYPKYCIPSTVSLVLHCTVSLVLYPIILYP